MCLSVIKQMLNNGVDMISKIVSVKGAISPFYIQLKHYTQKRLCRKKQLE